MKGLLSLLVGLAAGAATAQTDNSILQIPGRGNDNSVMTPWPRDDGTIQFPLRVGRTDDAILSAELFNARGDLIYFRALADRESGHIIGTSDRDLQIEILRSVNDGQQMHFIISGRKDGQRYPLGRDDVALLNQYRAEECSELAPYEAEKIPLQVFFAVDISGSMRTALPDVRGSVANFLRQLPETARCEMMLFDGGTFYVVPDGASPSGATFERRTNGPLPQCSLFASERLLRDMITSRGGGTDIVGAMTATYGRVMQFEQAHNLIMVLSDGFGQFDTARAFSRLGDLKLHAVNKAGAFTFVNWLGDRNHEARLAELADGMLVGQIGSGPIAQEFFQSVTDELASQYVLSTCE